MLIRIPEGWEIPEREATPEHKYMNRRQILKAAGFLGFAGLARAKVDPAAKRNPEFELDRPVTPDWAALGFNNYYEFHATDKEAVKNLVGNFVTSPWAIEVRGLVNRPGRHARPGRSVQDHAV